MSARTLWQIGGAIAFVVILLLGWFLVVSPMLASAATNDRLRADVDRQNAALQQAIDDISQVDVAALQAQLDVLTREVPDAVEEPEIMRQLQAAGAAAGATFSGVTFNGTLLFTPVPDTEGAPPLPITPEDLQTVADAGLLVVQFTATVAGDTGQVLAFADALQASGRLMLVQAVDISAPNSESGGGSVRGMAFVLPAPAEP